MNQDRPDLPDVNDPVLQAIEARNVEEHTELRPLTMEAVTSVAPRHTEPPRAPLPPPSPAQPPQPVVPAPQKVSPPPQPKPQPQPKPEPSPYPMPDYFATQPKAPVGKKVFATLLVVLLLAGAAGAIYYFWPTIQDTLLG